MIFYGQKFFKMENLAQFRGVICGDVFWKKLQANSEIDFTMYVTHKSVKPFHFWETHGKAFSMRLLFFAVWVV